MPAQRKLDKVPPHILCPPLPTIEVEVPLSASDAPLTSQGSFSFPASPAQPSTSRAPPLQESPSAAAAAAVPDSQAPPAKRRKASGKSTAVEIPQKRWAWEAEQHRLAVDERRLGLEERQLMTDERALVVQERMAAALENVAFELAAIRADTAAIRQSLEN